MRWWMLICGHGFFSNVHGDVDFKLGADLAVGLNDDVSEVSAFGFGGVGDGDLVGWPVTSGHLFKKDPDFGRIG